MELSVGMYVRVKDLANICHIGKIYNINDFREPSMKYCIDIQASDFVFVSEEMIVKASHNIIDLIEVGDYVNGCYVSNRRASVNERLGGHPKGIGIIKCNVYFNQGNYNDCEFKWIEEKDIKSIVTKEQFSQLEYKVGE